MIHTTYKQAHAHQLAKTIPLQPCEVCGATKKIRRHHDDYDQPLDVRFLCAKHHAQWHSVNEAKNYTKLNPLPKAQSKQVERGRYYKRERRRMIKMVAPDLSYILSL